MTQVGMAEARQRARYYATKCHRSWNGYMHATEAVVFGALVMSITMHKEPSDIPPSRAVGGLDALLAGTVVGHGR